MNIYNKKYLEILNGNYVVKGKSCKKICDNIEIINEDVYRLVSYDKFYDFLINSNEKRFCLKYKQVMDLFPLNSIEYKKMKKFKKRSFNIILDIAVCDFNDGNDIYNAIKYFVENPSDELVQELYSTTCENGDPCTCNIDETKILMIFPLNFSKNILRHEFIHYLQFIKNANNSYIETDLFKSEVQDILESDFNIDDEVIEYLNDLNEYEPLLNDFFDKLRDFKNVYYNNMTDLEFARFIYKILFRHVGEYEITYLNRVLSYEYFSELYDLNNSYGLQLIIYFNLLKYRVIQIKNLLFGYFSKQLIPKYS